MGLRKFVIVAALAAVAFLAIGNYRAFVDSHGQIIASDYSVYRFAAILLWQGDLATLFDPAKFIPAHEAFEQAPVGFSPFPYPPTALWFIAPLVAFPMLPGLLLWLGTTFAAFAWLVCRRLAQPGAAALALFAAPGSLLNVSFGQNGFLTGALLCGGLLLLGETPVIAGVLFGLLSFKPQFGLLLPVLLIAGRQYRAFFSAAVVTVALLLGSLVLFGTAPWQAYFSGALAVQRSFLETGAGPAITSTPSFFVAGRILGLPIAIDYGIQAVATVLVLGAVAWAFRQPASLETKAALAMVGAFLATPYCSSSDMGIIAAAQILLLSRGEAVTPREYALHGLVWLLPLLMVPFSVVHIPIGAPALAVLFCLILRRINATRTARTAPIAQPAP